MSKEKQLGSFGYYQQHHSKGQSPRSHSQRVATGEKKCIKCGKTPDQAILTKHHYNGSNKGPWDWMCRSPCHNDEHGITQLIQDEKRKQRLMRRAQIRFKNDVVIRYYKDEWVHIIDGLNQIQKKQLLRYLYCLNSYPSCTPIECEVCIVKMNCPYSPKYPYDEKGLSRIQ